MTDEEVRELLQQHRMLVGKFENTLEKEKDGWDALATALTPLAVPLISLVIALVGLHSSNVCNDRQRESVDSYNQAQVRLAAANAVSPFMPYITGKDEKAKAYAVLAISRLDAQLGVELDQAYQTEPEASCYREYRRKKRHMLLLPQDGRSGYARPVRFNGESQ